LKRRRAALGAVAILAGLFATVNLGEKPAAASTVAASVILYDDANWSGASGGTVISDSNPDLSQIGWSGRVSSLRIQGGISIAVYSQSNYTGTCDTFVGHDPWLGNNQIGNDHIASVRMFANCSGSVVDPVVADLTAVTGSSDQVQCPSDYVKRDPNLNAGTGGDFIYLCLHYGSKATVGDDALTGLVDFVGPIPPPFACDYTSSGPTRLPVDLNAGAGAGSDYVYLCYYTRANNDPMPDGVQGSLRDVDFVVSDSSLGLTDRQARCNDVFEDVSVGTISSAVVDSLPDDMNASAGGEYIYPCTLNYEFELAASPDQTPPTISFAGRTPAANPAGWNATPVTLRWNCSDNVGVVHSQVLQTVSSNGANQSVMGTCVDTSGNIATDTRTGISIDTALPVITFANRTPPNANGWNRSDVPVRWNCADALSGVVQPVAVVTVTTEGANQSATGTCTDRAGNTVSNTQAGINLDKTAPSLVPSVAGPNAFGWFRADVTVAWICADAGGSGLAGNCPASDTITGEGIGRPAVQSIGDRAGNLSYASVLLNIDRTPPQISAPTRAPAPNANGWNNSDVAVTWTCSDALSGALTPSTTQFVGGNGGDLSATGTCTDKADNLASNTATGIKIDRTPPVLTASAAIGGVAAYVPGTWTNQAVIVTFTCTDKLSGVASVTPPYSFGAGTDQGIAGDCVDNAGNRSTASFGGIDIDQAAPVMTCSANPVSLGTPDHSLAPVTVTVELTDDQSGPGTSKLVSVTSSEPDSGLGIDDEADDIQGFEVGTADTDGFLRAERFNKVGRTYTLTYQGTDAVGNAAICQTTVTAPFKPGS
jgi:hypothetical protein